MFSDGWSCCEIMDRVEQENKRWLMIDDFFNEIVFKAGYLRQNWVFLQRRVYFTKGEQL